MCLSNFFHLKERLSRSDDNKYCSRNVHKKRGRSQSKDSFLLRPLNRKRSEIGVVGKVFEITTRLGNFECGPPVNGSLPQEDQIHDPSVE